MKTTYGIVKHIGKVTDDCGGVGPRDVQQFEGCESIEAAVEKYRSLAICQFEDGQQVRREGAFYCVPCKEIGARLPFVSREALIAAKRNSRVNWDKLANWYGFLPDWAETPERYAARRAEKL
jgi:hypothetical protein